MSLDRPQKRKSHNWLIKQPKTPAKRNCQVYFERFLIYIEFYQPRAALLISINLKVKTFCNPISHQRRWKTNFLGSLEGFWAPPLQFRSPTPGKFGEEKTETATEKAALRYEVRNEILHLRFKRKWKLLQSYFAQPSRQQKNWDEKWTFLSPRVSCEKREKYFFVWISRVLPDIQRKKILHLPRNGEPSARTQKDDLKEWRLIRYRSSLKFLCHAGKDLD